MAWVGIYAFLMLVCALNSKLLAAGVIAAVGVSILYPEVEYAVGLCTWLVFCAVLANTRD